MATYPYAPPAKPGLTVTQKPVNPRWQFLQKPHPTLNGITTLSPADSDLTAGPTSSITPMFSWPKMMPGSAAVRPSYNVQVGAADATGGNLDDHIVRVQQLWIGDFLYSIH